MLKGNHQKSHKNDISKNQKEKANEQESRNKKQNRTKQNYEIFTLY